MRRAIQFLAALAACAWLVGALIVLLAGPAIPTGHSPHTLAWMKSRSFDEYKPDPLLDWSLYGSPEIEFESAVLRGALNRSKRTFPLSVELVNRTEIVVREIRLATSTSSDTPEDSSSGWREVARARVAEGSYSALIDSVEVDADTEQYRLEFLFADGTSDSVVREMPAPSSMLGRVHDTIGQWVVFRWLPGA